MIDRAVIATIKEQMRGTMQPVTQPDEQDENWKAWKEAKRGKFSSSNAYKLMSYQNKIDNFPDGANTYVMQKVVELTRAEGVEIPELNTYDVRWGKDHETEAAERLKADTDYTLTKYGADQELIHYTGKEKELVGHLVCTPDGDIDKHTGYESKCPAEHTHFNLLLNLQPDNLKQVEKKWYWQLQCTMWIWGKKQMIFHSYDPRRIDRLQSKYWIIKRNEDDIADLKKRMKMAVGKKFELMQELGLTT